MKLLIANAFIKYISAALTPFVVTLRPCSGVNAVLTLTSFVVSLSNHANVYVLRQAQDERRLLWPHKIFMILLCIVITYTSTHAKNYRIRVLLDEHAVNEEAWQISCPEGFVLIQAEGGKKEKAYPVKKLDVSLKNKSKPLIYLNDNCYLKNKIYIVPQSGYLSFNGKQYQGSFLIAKDGNKLLLINCVDLEDYLCGVVHKESWPGWPLEVNKVFAIASRSYVLSMILDAKISKRLYHVRDTNKHQTYGGVHNNNEIRNAIEQTRGVYLGYDGKPIVAMFDACCGGIIPARIHNMSKTPYLAREYPCTHCQTCKLYKWRVEFKLQDFEKQIRKTHKSIKQLNNFMVKKRDKAGLVQEVIVKGKPKDIALSGQKIYAMFDQIKSFCFHVSKKGSKLVIKGRGRGHHRGLCQWGACEMVKRGWGDYQAILSFYYPGTTFMKLS